MKVIFAWSCLIFYFFCLKTSKCALQWVSVLYIQQFLPKTFLEKIDIFLLKFLTSKVSGNFLLFTISQITPLNYNIRSICGFWKSVRVFFEWFCSQRVQILNFPKPFWASQYITFSPSESTINAHRKISMKVSEFLQRSRCWRKTWNCVKNP